MANYDDPHNRSQRDPNRPLDSYNVNNVERGSGSGILIALLAIFVVLGGLFLFFGGSNTGDGTVPATAPAVEEPAATAPATDPAATAPATDPAAAPAVEDPAAAPAPAE
jgi:hypothetical protein